VQTACELKDRGGLWTDFDAGQPSGCFPPPSSPARSTRAGAGSKPALCRHGPTAELPLAGAARRLPFAERSGCMDYAHPASDNCTPRCGVFPIPYRCLWSPYSSGPGLPGRGCSTSQAPTANPRARRKLAFGPPSACAKLSRYSRIRRSSTMARSALGGCRTVPSVMLAAQVPLHRDYDRLSMFPPWLERAAIVTGLVPRSSSVAPQVKQECQRRCRKAMHAEHANGVMRLIGHGPRV
jgi:hypothetical protein